MRSEPDTVHTFEAGRTRLITAGDSCVGNRYPANFDVLHVDPDLPFVAVADGMGGGRGSTVAGETAMATVVEAVRTAGQGRARPTCGPPLPPPRTGSAPPAGRSAN
ncbi:hypothetical protein [Micromonospora zhanjiangensis]